jgi:protein SCO1
VRNGPIGLFVAALAAAALATAAGAAGGPSFDGGRIDNPSPLPGFTLHDQSGRTVSLAGQRGRVVALTFLYTHCKDICPLTAQNLSQAVRMLGHSASAVRVLAVSVDPKGDTPASVRRFVRVHRLVPEFRYLTGTRAQLTQVWRQYGVSWGKEKSGELNHTLYTVLADRSGKGRVLYDATATPVDLAHDLRLLLRLGT